MEAPPRLRWFIVALAFFATLISYLDRLDLSVTAPVSRAQFHMTNTAYSRVILAFMLAYTVMNGVSGPHRSRRDPHRIRGVHGVVFGGRHAARGSERNFEPRPLRFLLGMVEAGNGPAAVKLVAEWFPPREGALASGIFNSGSAAEAILVPPLVSAIVLAAGWRYAFLAVGLTGLALLGPMSSEWPHKQAELEDS